MRPFRYFCVNTKRFGHQNVHYVRSPWRGGAFRRFGKILTSWCWVGLLVLICRLSFVSGTWLVSDSTRRSLRSDDSRGATNTQQLRRQNFCSRGTSPVELSSSPAAQSRHHLRTVQTTAERTPLSGSMNMALCDFWYAGAIEKHLLTYLLTCRKRKTRTELKKTAKIQKSKTVTSKTTSSLIYDSSSNELLLFTIISCNHNIQALSQLVIHVQSIAFSWWWLFYSSICVEIHLAAFQFQKVPGSDRLPQAVVGAGVGGDALPEQPQHSRVGSSITNQQLTTVVLMLLARCGRWIRAGNGSMGHGSWVKWVTKIGWVTWVTGHYVLTHDPSVF